MTRLRVTVLKTRPKRAVVFDAAVSLLGVVMVVAGVVVWLFLLSFLLRFAWGA